MNWSDPPYKYTASTCWILHRIDGDSLEVNWMMSLAQNLIDPWICHQMTSKWPLNDLKWPIVTCKCNFLTKSHFWACHMFFHRFFFNAESIVPVRFEFRVTKWPPNDLKWPIVTCKHNFVTQSHFGACYMSFHRFFFNAESIVPIIFEFWVTKWPPNDLKGPILTSHHLRSFWGHLVTWNLKLISPIESAFQNTYEKTYGMPEREIWPKNFVVM